MWIRETCVSPRLHVLSSLDLDSNSVIEALAILQSVHDDTNNEVCTMWGVSVSLFFFSVWTQELIVPSPTHPTFSSPTRPTDWEDSSSGDN